MCVKKVNEWANEQAHPSFSKGLLLKDKAVCLFFTELQLTVIFIRLISQIIVKLKCTLSFPTAQDFLFYPTNSPKHKDSQFTITEIKENHKIFTFEKLEPLNVDTKIIIGS